MITLCGILKLTCGQRRRKTQHQNDGGNSVLDSTRSFDSPMLNALDDFGVWRHLLNLPPGIEHVDRIAALYVVALSRGMVSSFAGQPWGAEGWSRGVILPATVHRVDLKFAVEPAFRIRRSPTGSIVAPIRFRSSSKSSAGCPSYRSHESYAPWHQFAWHRYRRVHRA